jgi:hypothetical protein
MIFVVNLTILLRLITSGNSADIKAMIEINNSYENYPVIGERASGQNRLTSGSALLAVFGLSLFGWAVVLAPLVVIFYK